MAQSQSAGSYKCKIIEAYAEARRKAKLAVRHSVTQSLESCANEGNVLLVHFLQEARDIMQAQGNENIAKAYGRGAKQVRRHPLRIYNKDRLLEVSGFGPATTSAVQKHLWSDEECKPRAPDREELEAEQRYFEAVRHQQLSQKEAEKQRKADERAAKKQADQAAAMLASPQPARRRTAAATARDVVGDNEVQAQPKKRQKKGKKEYIPGVGTANYAFMIALFQAQQGGELYLTKHDLINRAEALHITSKPIKGNPNVPVAPGMFVYDGWTCFNSLTNREPPLAQVYSNPKKCRLTPEGELLARRLYKDAVERQSVPADPAILHYIRRTEPAGEDATGSQASMQAHSSAGARQSVGASQVSASRDVRAPYTEAPYGHAWQEARLARPQPGAPVSGDQLAAINVPIHVQAGTDVRAGMGPPPWPAASLAASLLHPSNNVPKNTNGICGSVSFATASHSAVMPASANVVWPAVASSAPAKAWDLSDDDDDDAEQHASLQARLIRKQARAAGAAASLDDASVAQLMEMGFTPKQAAKELAGGCSVEEAVEIIALDSDSEPEAEQPGGAKPPTMNAAAHVSMDSQHGSSSQQSQPLQLPNCHLPIQHQSRFQDPAASSLLPGHASAPAAMQASGLQPLLPAFSQASQRSTGSDLPQRAGHLAPRAASVLAATHQGLSAGGRSRHIQTSSLDSLVGDGRQHHTQSRMQAAWRLRGVAEGGFVEETDIRLPPLAEGEYFGDRYEVALVLDNRERFGSHIRSTLGSDNSVAEKHAEAVRQLTSLGVKTMSKAIEAGDALWVAQPRSGGAAFALDTIIERKRIDDLVASIKDGRYERQRYFLARCGMRRTMYVLEGDIDLACQGPMAKACKTAMHRLELEDGFRVLRTPDSAHTFRLYQRITQSLQAKYAVLRPESPCVARSRSEALPTLEQLEERLRLAKQVTLRDVWGLMLCTVPRISSENCEVILRVYPTPISLWRAYERVLKEAAASGNNTVAAANALLTRLPRIGPETSRLVFSSLFANGWQLC